MATNPIAVYLAGPDVFLPNALPHGRALIARCRELGLCGHFPLEGELESCATKQEQARAIFRNNVRIIESCDALLANITPFRGIHMDPGTAWEIGYACALGLPVFAYSQSCAELRERLDVTREKTGPNQDGTQWRDQNGYAVEDFGSPENLMITCSIVGPVHTSFDAAATACAAHFARSPTQSSRTASSVNTQQP